MLKIERTPTVYVVQVDHTKDLSDAKRYGTLQAVYGNPRKPYDTQTMINTARKVLDNWKPGDYLLMIGDPALCAVCMSIITEEDGEVNVLSWDRNTFQYLPTTWDFDQYELDFENYDNGTERKN
jgi:hypothetical protein